MKKLALVTLIGLAGCGLTPSVSDSTTRNGLSYSFIGTVDGCKIFRLYDAGDFVYFAHCSTTQRVSWRRQAGKTSYPKSVETVQ